MRHAQELASAAGVDAEPALDTDKNIDQRSISTAPRGARSCGDVGGSVVAGEPNNEVNDANDQTAPRGAALRITLRASASSRRFSGSQGGCTTRAGVPSSALVIGSIYSGLPRKIGCYNKAFSHRQRLSFESMTQSPRETVTCP